MRITLGSLMATAAAVLLFLSLVPGHHPELAPHHANADEKRTVATPPPTGTGAPGATNNPVADDSQAVEKALTGRGAH